MCVCVCVCMYVCMHVYMYVAIEEKNRETILSSLQACFVIDEWAITKQACSDESIVSLFFPPVATYITLYFYVSSTVKRKNQYTDFLYIYTSTSPPPLKPGWWIVAVSKETKTCKGSAACGEVSCAIFTWCLHVQSDYIYIQRLFFVMQLKFCMQAAGNRNDNNTWPLDAKYQFSLVCVPGERAFDL